MNKIKKAQTSLFCFYKKKIFLREALNSGKIAQANRRMLTTKKSIATKGDQIIEIPPVKTKSISNSSPTTKAETKRKVKPRHTSLRLGKNSQIAIAITVKTPKNATVGRAKGKNHHQPLVCHAINKRYKTPEAKTIEATKTG